MRLESKRREPGFLSYFIAGLTTNLKFTQIITAFQIFLAFLRNQKSVKKGIIGCFSAFSGLKGVKKNPVNKNPDGL